MSACVVSPSRVPERKWIYAESVHDAKLRAAGLAARGLYAMILAGADEEGVLRDEGTTRAEVILATAAGVDVQVVESLLGRLAREGLARRSTRGVELPAETFARRQPEIALRASSYPPPGAEAPSSRPAARSAVPSRVAPPPPPSTTPRRAPGRPALGAAPRSQVERDDRRRFARGEGRFAGVGPGVTFDAWITGTDEGRAWAAFRRERVATYALPHDSTKLLHETPPRNSSTKLDGIFVESSSPVPSLVSPEEERLIEGKQTDSTKLLHENAGGNSVEPPSSSFVEPPNEESPEAPPRALPAPDAVRDSTRAQAAAFRAFVDACNASEVVDGRSISREVVMELGARREQTLALGAALLDAGCTAGTPLFAEAVNVLRDRDVFRAVYARRKCAAVCKIAVGELVYQGALALKQALNVALARLPGKTLYLLPAAASPARPKRYAGGSLRPEEFTPAGADKETTVITGDDYDAVLRRAGIFV